MSTTTNNMGLRAWDLGSDPYSHSELASNFVIIDDHDHGAQGGAQIQTAGIADNAITAAKLASGSIDTSTIEDRSLLGGDIAVGTITGENIQDGSIGSTDLADGSVTLDKLSSEAIPVGMVTAWYRPSASYSPPSNWEICDGRAWNTVANAWGWTVGYMPDLRNRFILGAAVAGDFGGSGPSDTPSIGQVGGAHTASLAHTHTVAGHGHNVVAHSHTINAHSHSMNHRHQVVSPLWNLNGKIGLINPTSAGTYESYPGSNPYVAASGTVQEAGGTYPPYNGALTFAMLATSPEHNDKYTDNRFSTMTYYQADDEITADIGPNGGIPRWMLNTSGPIDPAGGATAYGIDTATTALTTNTSTSTTDDTSLTTNPSLTTHDNRPAFVGLLYIMRVR